MSEETFHKQDTLPEDNENGESAIEIPKFIGEYKIENLLEKGGMSVIFLATHPGTLEPVIIKVLSSKYVSNQDVIERFIAEAEIIKLTDHPNIVKLYGHGKWEDVLYIAMEYIQGVSLRQYLQYNPLSVKRALEIILEIAYALCHLHTHGIIHRDLKLENILITETGNIKLIDFGIAQTLKDKTDSNLPVRQRLIGTPIYMSPEQRENPEYVSYPSDIYSLGIIAYELVLGKLSHGHIHLGLMPKGLQKILAKTLQPRPEDRYQDIVDFITDLSAYLNSTSLQRERKEGDLLSEFSEQLQHAQISLVPETTPHWPKVEMGIAYHKGMTVAGIYYDFFSLPSDQYAIVMAESTIKGVEGVVNTAMLRGMIRSLSRITSDPAPLANLLNDLLINDTRDRIFAFSYLLLSPEDNLFRYISCGYGNLWFVPHEDENPQKISTENVALGLDRAADFKVITHKWNFGDNLVLSSLTSIKSEEQPMKEFNQEHFKRALIDNLKLKPQKQVEAILRRAKGGANRAFEQNSLAAIGIQRIA